MMARVDCTTGRMEANSGEEGRGLFGWWCVELHLVSVGWPARRSLVEGFHSSV